MCCSYVPASLILSTADEESPPPFPAPPDFAAHAVDTGTSAAGREREVATAHAVSGELRVTPKKPPPPLPRPGVAVLVASLPDVPAAGSQAGDGALFAL